MIIIAITAAITDGTEIVIMDGTTIVAGIAKGRRTAGGVITVAHGTGARAAASCSVRFGSAPEEAAGDRLRSRHRDAGAERCGRSASGRRRMRRRLVERRIPGVIAIEPARIA
jgi:hypothetical protein